MDDNSASVPSQGEKDDKHAVESSLADRRGSVREEHAEKNGSQRDSSFDEAVTFKLTFKIFLSLTAMAFLWVGSQIPLYLFGSVLAIIYSDIGGADRWTWFVVGYLIPNAAVCPFVGALSDLFGRRGVALVGQLFLIVGPIVTSVAHSMNVAIGGAVLSGFGAGLNELIALSGTAELVPARLRGAYVGGLVFTILPFVPSTLYAQLIAKASNWRYVGILVAVWNFIGLLLVAFAYKPPPRPNALGLSRGEILRQIDYVGGLLSTIGVMCFMMGMQWGATQYEWASVHVLVPFFIGVLGIIAFFVWEVRFAPYPMVPKKLFSKDKRTMAVILFITFISGANFFAVLLIWPTQNYQVYGYDPVGIGLRTLPVGVGILLGSFLVLVLITVTKGRIKLLMICAAALMTAGTGSMAVGAKHNLPTMYGLVSIASLGVGGVIIPCSIIAQLVCPDELIGTITAITLAIRYIGGAIGFSVYENVLYHKFLPIATDLVGIKTIVGGGLVAIKTEADLLLVQELVTLSANAQFNQLKNVIATNPSVVRKDSYNLIVGATQEAWASAYKWPYYTSIAWGVAALGLSFFLRDIRRFLDNHVAVSA